SSPASFANLNSQTPGATGGIGVPASATRYNFSQGGAGAAEGQESKIDHGAFLYAFYTGRAEIHGPNLPRLERQLLSAIEYVQVALASRFENGIHHLLVTCSDLLTVKPEEGIVDHEWGKTFVPALREVAEALLEAMEVLVLELADARTYLNALFFVLKKISSSDSLPAVTKQQEPPLLSYLEERPSYFFSGEIMGMETLDEEMDIDGDAQVAGNKRVSGSNNEDEDNVIGPHAMFPGAKVGDIAQLKASSSKKERASISDHTRNASAPSPSSSSSSSLHRGYQPQLGGKKTHENTKPSCSNQQAAPGSAPPRVVKGPPRVVGLSNVRKVLFSAAPACAASPAASPGDTRAGDLYADFVQRTIDTVLKNTSKKSRDARQSRNTRELSFLKEYFAGAGGGEDNGGGILHSTCTSTSTTTSTKSKGRSFFRVFPLPDLLAACSTLLDDLADNVCASTSKVVAEIDVEGSLTGEGVSPSTSSAIAKIATATSSSCCTWHTSRPEFLRVSLVASEDATNSSGQEHEKIRGQHEIQLDYWQVIEQDEKDWSDIRVSMNSFADTKTPGPAQLRKVTRRIVANSPSSSRSPGVVRFHGVQMYSFSQALVVISMREEQLGVGCGGTATCHLVMVPLWETSSGVNHQEQDENQETHDVVVEDLSAFLKKKLVTKAGPQGSADEAERLQDENYDELQFPAPDVKVRQLPDIFADGTTQIEVSQQRGVCTLLHEGSGRLLTLDLEDDELDEEEEFSDDGFGLGEEEGGRGQ
ncbi:unnamed protein product, partial [Amoebophrya sp. A25]